MLPLLTMVFILRVSKLGALIKFGKHINLHNVNGSVRDPEHIKVLVDFFHTCIPNSKFNAFVSSLIFCRVLYSRNRTYKGSNGPLFGLSSNLVLEESTIFIGKFIIPCML